MEEELPQGDFLEEREPVDAYRELCGLLQRPRSTFAPFHDLLLCASSILFAHGWESPDQEWTDFKLTFDQQLAETKQFLVWSSRFQEKTDQFVEHISQAFDLLELLRCQSARLDESVVQADALNFVFALEQIELALCEFSTQLQALRDLESRSPQYCEVPYVQDLFRLAEAVRRGALEKELLAERLLAFEEVQGFIRESLREQGELSASDLRAVEEAFSLQDDGLDLMFAYLDTGKTSALEKGLGWVQQAWDKLLRLRHQMLAAQEAAHLPTCPQCGLVNPQGVRRCSACQTYLSNQSLAFSPTSGGNFERMAEAIADLNKGRLSLQQFAEEVESYRRVYQEGEVLLERLSLVRPCQSAETDHFGQACSLYCQGLQDLDAGISQLEQFVDLQRRQRLRQEVPPGALELIFSGQQSLVQLQELGGNGRQTGHWPGPSNH